VAVSTGNRAVASNSNEAGVILPMPQHLQRHHAQPRRPTTCCIDKLIPQYAHGVQPLGPRGVTTNCLVEQLDMATTKNPGRVTTTIS
jgi:hypothetical protein